MELNGEFPSRTVPVTDMPAPAFKVTTGTGTRDLHFRDMLLPSTTAMETTLGVTTTITRAATCDIAVTTIMFSRTIIITVEDTATTIGENIAVRIRSTAGRTSSPRQRIMLGGVSKTHADAIKTAEEQSCRGASLAC